MGSFVLCLGAIRLENIGIGFFQLVVGFSMADGFIISIIRVGSFVLCFGAVAFQNIGIEIFQLIVGFLWLLVLLLAFIIIWEGGVQLFHKNTLLGRDNSFAIADVLHFPSIITTE